MPADWLKIRQARSGVTDYLIHWTRRAINADGDYESAFDVLKAIIQCGCLRPSFSPKTRVTVGGRENTIRGPHPAVCFTERPAEFYA